MNKHYYGKSKLNHTKVDYYKVTLNSGFESFLIHPAYLTEHELKFVYEDAGKTIEKIVPVKHIGPHLKLKQFWKTNEETLRKEYKGMAYMVPAKVIYNYL